MVMGSSFAGVGQMEAGHAMCWLWGGLPRLLAGGYRLPALGHGAESGRKCEPKETFNLGTHVIDRIFDS